MLCCSFSLFLSQSLLQREGAKSKFDSKLTLISPHYLLLDTGNEVFALTDITAFVFFSKLPESVTIESSDCEPDIFLIKQMLANTSLLSSYL